MYRLLVLKTAWMIDTQPHGTARMHIAMCKVAMARVYHDIVRRAVHLHGALGTTHELPLAKMWMGVPMLSVADGPTEVHQIQIANALLKKTQPAPGLFPSEHIPTRQARARADHADALAAAAEGARTVAPATVRAVRRVDAERTVRAYGRRAGVAVGILRIPGIYAVGRPGGDPRERLRRGTPVLVPADDVYTNHIHADDLARACVAALHRGRAGRVVNVCDDSDMKMGDYMDLAADLSGLARPERVGLAEARERLTPMHFSFFQESRRPGNRRLKQELKLRLRYPTVKDGLVATPLPVEP